MCQVNKISMYTNEIIKTYTSASVAGMLNGDSAPRVINQCERKGGTQIPQQGYYYRYVDDSPTPHKIVEIFDADFEKLGEFINIKEAEHYTGVGRYSIGKQLANPLPLKERKAPSSGIYFVWKDVM